MAAPLRPSARAPNVESPKWSCFERGSHMRYTRRMIAALLPIILFSATAPADIVEPTDTKYDFEKVEEGGARSCRLALIISNYPAPETAIFRLLAAMSMTPGGGIFFGFSFDVGDTVFRSGLPTGMTRAPLVEAEFASPDFASGGRLQRVSTADGGYSAADGGYMAVSQDPRTTADFLAAFTRGEFEITFQREASRVLRTYKIHRLPPSNLVIQFLDCADTYRQ
jgi:hypothetical protein